MTYTPHPDLTPPHLRAAGYTIVAHGNGGWCWQRANRYGAGTVYGAPYERVEDACASVRLAGRRRIAMAWRQLSLGEVTR